MNFIALVIFSGNLFFTKAIPIPSKIKFITTRGIAKTPVSKPSTGDSEILLVKRVKSAGNTTETRDNNTTVSVDKKTAHEIIF